MNKKGKNLSGQDMTIGIKGLLSGFGGMLYESESARENRKLSNTKLKNSVVDTCFTPDTDFWETGIEPNGMHWIIVEEYKNKKDAKAGHEKWVKYMKTNPKKLYSIQSNEWEILI